MQASDYLDKENSKANIPERITEETTPENYVFELLAAFRKLNIEPQTRQPVSLWKRKPYINANYILNLHNEWQTIQVQQMLAQFLLLGVKPETKQPRTYYLKKYITNEYIDALQIELKHAILNSNITELLELFEILNVAPETVQPEKVTESYLADLRTEYEMQTKIKQLLEGFDEIHQKAWTPKPEKINQEYVQALQSELNYQLDLHQRTNEQAQIMLSQKTVNVDYENIKVNLVIENFYNRCLQWQVEQIEKYQYLKKFSELNYGRKPKDKQWALPERDIRSELAKTHPDEGNYMGESPKIVRLFSHSKEYAYFKATLKNEYDALIEISKKKARLELEQRMEQREKVLTPAAEEPINAVQLDQQEINDVNQLENQPKNKLRRA